ncbi:hypothetical protein HOLleu_26497 [Holothuria leucospilota]|uniref:Uncharacterized protein n=1 Tax=Holothuria leucospilota TaxID=206669 RepID=A0A9Q1BNY1_HOLLE|nr:hypothetical protein HOLleu_26497 [Holothuria leucospilota]
MRYGKRKNPIIFGGGERSSGVTGSQTLKTSLTRYLKMRYGKRKNPIIFGGGERSSGVTGGQILKTSLTRYLKKGSSDSSQTWYIDAPY